MRLPAPVLKAIGSISLLGAVAALLGIPLGIAPAQPLDSYLLMIAMLVAISCGILVAARLQARQDPLAEKAVPSTLVAYLLFILIALRWLTPN
ncbi:MAG TPA: hypothetical protein VIS52_02840 [Motiliproteus sp.]